MISITAVLACGARPASASAARAKLVVPDSLVQAAVVPSDAARLASHYADDAVLMPVAEPIVEGRTAIRAEWQHVFGSPGLANSARVVAVEASSAGDLGHTRGTYTSPMRGPDGQPIVEQGKWVSVWKRQADGQWRIVVDIYNTDSTPPIHAPSRATPVQFSRSEPCPPPSAFPGRPYFDFQVDKAAVYTGKDSVPIRPIEQRMSRPYPSDFALAQFIVDSLGVPVPGTLKLLIHPKGLSREDVLLALVDWRYQPARVAECRVPQLVQTPLRWK